MSTPSAWPEVPKGEHGEMKCPMGGCNADLYLNRTYTIPLTAEQAAHDEHVASAAITDGWEVECTNGHTLLLCTDVEETHEPAAEYDHLLLHLVSNRIWEAHR